MNMSERYSHGEDIATGVCADIAKLRQMGGIVMWGKNFRRALRARGGGEPEAIHVCLEVELEQDHFH